ncbi:acyl-CoA carboxylase subunit epsilon [Nocardiopsis gilva YIM 90087]|uniref:Acyl-CoA carboxylase subunit epsilon n=1 Tax=Nocardiopsis gilva YIM 90087 TaxID=1235441 RepID=A0A223SBW1_9ACTN|nr:acyl-CoA carboxylase subunit epsilon [Nocardiopsis gilva]ASU85543.1 acyl-CoA carboxylase subunit epsilon [Nocardiopsis gilva YIM 90087]
MSNAAEQPRSPAPYLRVVRGDPSNEEVAALVTVLTARARATRTAHAAAASGRGAPSAWRDRSRLVRRPLTPGPGAWRNSFRSG